MDIQDIRETYGLILQLFEKNGEQYKKQLIQDLIIYLVWLGGADDNFSDKKIQFVEDIMDMKLINMPELYDQLNCDKLKLLFHYQGSPHFFQSSEIQA